MNSTTKTNLFHARARSQQAGMGFIPLVMVLAMCGIALLLGLKLVPLYIEFFSIKKVVTQMVTSDDVKNASVADLRRAYDRRAIIDDIKMIKGDDLEITKEGGETVIRAAWEQKIPLFKGYTLLVDFAVSSADAK